MKTKINRIVIYAVLTLIGVSTLIPFLFAVSSSFKPQSCLFERSILTIKDFTLDNYIRLFVTTSFPRWLFNSTIVGVSFSLLSLFFCSLAGYSFAKYDFLGKNALFLIVIGSMTIPPWVMIVPLFTWFTRLRLINTYWALILPGSASGFGIFLMRQYIHGIPSEILDSARIDGCSDFRIYYQIVLPLIKPALGALGIFVFMNSWNNFISPLVFIRTPDMFTIPVGLAAFVGQNNPEFSLLMAGGMISVIPILIIFLIMQKQFVAGLTLGAVKE
ncbi:MAG: ABC transporter permease subunit [Clostridia bacterium]|nr:ABC transporter permease subunit [Clostridia bacterium]